MNPRRFVGKAGYYSDDGTGLDLLGVRYYDPHLGCFISPDPVQSGLNWYEYAGDNPVNQTDPNGETPQPLSALQRSYVSRAIGYINHVSYYSEYYGKGLSHLFDVGHIDYDPDQTGGRTHWGFAGIRADISIGDIFSDANLRVSTTKFRGTVTLAATLVHEYQHVLQGLRDNVLCVGASELEAYTTEQNFLTMLYGYMDPAVAAKTGYDIGYWGDPKQVAQRQQGVYDVAKMKQEDAKDALGAYGLDKRFTAGLK